jgi:hypothetical protein
VGGNPEHHATPVAGVDKWFFEKKRTPRGKKIRRKRKELRERFIFERERVEREKGERVGKRERERVREVKGCVGLEWSPSAQEEKSMHQFQFIDI